MSSTVLQISDRGHEQVAFFRDPGTGVQAIIAVHNTKLGPAIGGCRVRPYASLDEALFDVLNLSEGMSYKNSLCGINFGGGKSVILADSRKIENREAVFKAFGNFMNSFMGSYYTAEDMGTSVQDVEYIGATTKYIVGSDPKKGGAGDPSPYTAKGTFDGIKASVRHVTGSDSLSGCKVAIQGVGSVGAYLAKLLHAEGAELIVCDTHEASVKSLVEAYGAKAVGVHDIYDADCDVFSPCAIGGTVNQETLPKLKCKIIAGAANNQVLTEELEKQIVAKGISYAPDFAINSGGVIAVADELEEGGFTQSRVDERVAKIGSTISAILKRSSESGELPGAVARKIAKERIAL